MARAAKPHAAERRTAHTVSSSMDKEQKRHMSNTKQKSRPPGNRIKTERPARYSHPSSSALTWRRSDEVNTSSVVPADHPSASRVLNNDKPPTVVEKASEYVEKGTQTPSPPSAPRSHERPQSSKPLAERLGTPSSMYTPSQQNSSYLHVATRGYSAAAPPQAEPQDESPRQPCSSTNPRVMLHQVVVRLGEKQLISRSVETALEEYIHTQKITQEDKNICNMEEKDQVEALNSIARKYPYDGDYGQGANCSPINPRAANKSSLQQKIEEELGSGQLYLLTGPEIWNRLDFGTTCVKSYDLVYTNSLEKSVEGTGFRIRFKKVSFALPDTQPSREWFIVDMCNNMQDLDITVQEFTARLRGMVIAEKVKSGCLKLFAGQFGTPQTCQIIDDALQCYVHQGPEFSALIRETAEHFHTRDVVILRDYLITHVLYSLQKSGHKVYLKGGCSLSLGYNLITRTSEDVDLRIDPSDNVIWEVNGRNAKTAEVSRMEYFLTLIDSMIIEDGDVKLHHTKCLTTQAVYHVTFSFPRIAPTPITIVLEVMHKVAPFYEKVPISSKLHNYMKSIPDTSIISKYKPNYDYIVKCTHPMQTLYEKIHAVYQNYNKFRRNDGNINAPKWIRHLGDAYTIITQCVTPLPAEWPLDKLQKELAKSGDFVVDLTTDHPSLNLAYMGEALAKQVDDAYTHHLEEFYYGERMTWPPNLRDVCATILGWLKDKPTDFMSHRVHRMQCRPPYRKYFHPNHYNINNTNSGDYNNYVTPANENVNNTTTPVYISNNTHGPHYENVRPGYYVGGKHNSSSGNNVLLYKDAKRNKYREQDIAGKTFTASPLIEVDS